MWVFSVMWFFLFACFYACIGFWSATSQKYKNKVIKCVLLSILCFLHCGGKKNVFPLFLEVKLMRLSYYLPFLRKWRPYDCFPDFTNQSQLSVCNIGEKQILKITKVLTNLWKIICDTEKLVFHPKRRFQCSDSIVDVRKGI